VLLSVPFNINSKNHKKTYQIAFVEGNKSVLAAAVGVVVGVIALRRRLSRQGTTPRLYKVTCLSNSDLAGRIVVSSGAAQDGSSSS
jgi:hypothetical protein